MDKKKMVKILAGIVFSVSASYGIFLAGYSTGGSCDEQDSNPAVSMLIPSSMQECSWQEDPLLSKSKKAGNYVIYREYFEPKDGGLLYRTRVEKSQQKSL